MTVQQMIERGLPLHRIETEVRRYVFAEVLKQERRVCLKGAKGRAAKRLGIHRNTVTREIWKPKPTPFLYELIAERDPPMSEKEIHGLSLTKTERRLAEEAATPVSEKGTQ